MKSFGSLIIGLAALLIMGCSPSGNVTWTVEKQEFIYPDDQKPTPECHASTIEYTSHGMVAAWFGGTEERNPDVGIWIALNHGGGWSRPVEVVNGIVNDTLRYPLWNPVLWSFNDEKLFLFYKMGPSPDSWWGMYMVSIDQGHTWSEPVRIPDPFLGPIKNKPILLSSGKLLCPSSTEHDGWKTHFEIFDPLTESWELFTEPSGQAEFTSIQPTVFHLKNDSLLALMRTKEGVMSQTTSDKTGENWTPVTAGSLPNPNSGFDGVTLKDGTFLMVYNPTTMPDDNWGGPRYPLVVGASKDGKNWQEILTLESEPGEFSYPAKIQSPDGKVHITYTHNRLKVAYVVLSK
jgi:predicted neuraminidase